MENGGVNGAACGQVHNISGGDVTDGGEITTAKFASREVKVHPPTKQGVVQKVLNFAKKLFPKFLFSRKVELQKSSISSQMHRNQSETTEVNKSQADIRQSDDYGQEAPTTRPILKKAKEQFDIHNKAGKRDRKVGMYENAEVHGQNYLGDSHKEVMHNAALKESRVMDDYDDVVDEASLDMAAYERINDAMEKRGFDKTLLADKSSKEVLKILKSNKLVTKRQIKEIERRKIDLEGSPYW